MTARQTWPSTRSTRFFQDHAGYIWIATQGGLNAYDGYRYRLYQHEPDNPASLPEDFVTAITEDAHNRIWLGSNNGNVASLEPESGTRSDLCVAVRCGRSRTTRQCHGAGIRPPSVGLDRHRRRHRADRHAHPASAAAAFTVSARRAGRQPRPRFARGRRRHALGGDQHRHRCALRRAADQAEPVAAAGIASASALSLAQRRRALCRNAQRVCSASIRSAKRRARLAAGQRRASRARRAPDRPGHAPAACGSRSHGAGLVVFDPATGTGEAVEHDYDMPGSLPEDNVTALFADRSGLALDRRCHTRLFDRRSARRALRLSSPTSKDEPAVNAGNNVRAIWEDQPGAPVVRHAGSRAEALRPRRVGKFESFNDAAGAGERRRHRARADHQRRSRRRRRHPVGRLGPRRLRTGSRRGATRARCRSTRNTDKGLPSAAVNALLPARDGSIWFGTADAGLAHWWPSSARWEYFPPVPNAARPGSRTTRRSRCSRIATNASGSARSAA